MTADDLFNAGEEEIIRRGQIGGVGQLWEGVDSGLSETGPCVERSVRAGVVVM